MQDLAVVASAFLEMAHRIVWCSVASVDAVGRPRSRVLHPIWEWNDGQLIGWIGTGPTPTKRAHLEASPYLSLNYWDSSQDTCVAECRAEWRFDPETRKQVWDAYKAAPPPLGYDPAIIPTWDSPASDSFAVLRLEPWRLRVFPGSVLLAQQGDVLVWQANAA
jgi:hypothetical protein